jgi:phenylacetate-coenzyme A ligase PaaK-like adenylate-forming protein
VACDAPSARTLATGLANRTFPFIRYDLGDQVQPLNGECGCGSAFARVADIGGRRDDDFSYPTSTIPASVFRHILGTDPRVSEYQVRQTVGGAEVQIQLVEHLPRQQASGKLRRFIPLNAQQNAGEASDS